MFYLSTCQSNKTAQPLHDHECRWVNAFELETDTTKVNVICLVTHLIWYDCSQSNHFLT